MKINKMNFVILLVSISFVFILIAANSTANIKSDVSISTNLKDLKCNVVTGDHSSIAIEGNDALATFIEDEGLSGDGTYTSPYIIEDFIINASTAHGIDIRSTNTYLIIQNCMIEGGNSDYIGIYLNNTANINIGDNLLSNNLIGIYLFDSCNNTLNMNNASSNANDGINICGDSCNNTISMNNASNNNVYGINICGDSCNNTIFGNTVNNNDWFGIYLFDSCNNTLFGNTVNYNTFYGIYLSDFSNYNTLSGNDVYSNSHGVYLSHYSNYNTLSGNTVNSNKHGIYLDDSSYNTLSKNIISYNTDEGIYLSTSLNNIITENTVNNNWEGIRLYSSSEYNTFTMNIISYNTDDGIDLDESGYNTFTMNSISYQRDYGIYLGDSCNNNTIYYNCIHGNTNNQAYEGNSATNNQWDNGTSGNYWGVDYTNNYPSATNDGKIWSIPYEISGTGIGIDHFPLVNSIIIDFSNPLFIDLPEDFSDKEGYLDLSISWIATDLYPATYTIELNGNKVVSTTVWTNGSTISYNIPDGMLIGDYNITIIITDKSGNTAQDTVIFTVTSTETTTNDDSTVDTGSNTPGFSLMVVVFAGAFLLIKRIKREKNL